jgi:cysteinyl-tRNA synthetase
MAWQDPEALSRRMRKFLDAICDDLNTPNALAVLYEENKNLNNLALTPLNSTLSKKATPVSGPMNRFWGLSCNPHLSEDDKSSTKPTMTRKQ